MITLTTADGLTHYLNSEASIALVESPNTRAALQAAYDAGDWEPYEPPQAEPELLPPDWEGFAAWRYQQPDYLALLTQYPGQVALFESAISRGELGPAAAILGSVASAIPIELAQNLAIAAEQFAIPPELAQMLLGVLNG